MDKDHCIAEAKENPHVPLVDSIENDILDLPSLSPECCIYRVPIRIRERNPKAYTPQMVSIGPLHHGEKELLGMEEFKLRCLKAFRDRTHISLDECLSKIKEQEQGVRNCYAERFDKLNSDRFVKMILLDCCFIIEVLLGIGRLFGKNVVSSDLRHVLELEGSILLDQQSDLRVFTLVVSDILLLENQLPFFIIEGLFNIAFHSNPDHHLPSFLQLFLFCIQVMIPIEDIARDISNAQVKHFVDLLRVCFLPSSPRSSLEWEEDFYFSEMPQATEMQKAGMIMSASSNHRLLDITYTDGVLQVPRLLVDDGTGVYLETFLPWRLIDSAQDVDLLIKSGAIYSLIDDHSVVATLFNNLCIGAVCGPYYYRDICKDVNKYCNVPRHKWKATLKRDYFSTPWRTASTVAAVIFLVLTFIQTIKAFF